MFNLFNKNKDLLTYEDISNWHVCDIDKTLRMVFFTICGPRVKRNADYAIGINSNMGLKIFKRRNSRLLIELPSVYEDKVWWELVPYDERDAAKIYGAIMGKVLDHNFGEWLDDHHPL